MSTLRIGIHTSRSGALENAALKAHELGANTFQIFSASPRMWKAKPPGVDEVHKFREARERFDLFPLAIHTNYLINLASLDAEIRPASITAFRGELERAATIGAEYLVVHPGNYRGHTLDEGLAAVVLSLQEASNGLEHCGVTVLLENTVGAGTQLGGKLEDLRTIRDVAAQVIDLPIGYCLDTCHLFGSGFDVATAAGLSATASEVERVLGFENVHVIHANDSKGKLGTHLDRHANIGEGNIGENGFRGILTHSQFREKPFILETPVDDEGDDRKNVDALKRLARIATANSLD